MGKLKSWSCGNCTNVIYIYVNDTLLKYCKPMLEHEHKVKWIGDEVVCCNKTTEEKESD